MNWAALTKKQQQMAVATVVVAVAWIFVLAHFLGWMRPAEARGGLDREELVDLEQKIAVARSFLIRSEQIRAALNESIGKLEKQKIFTPASSDRYAWAYEYVSRCATQSGIELDRVEEIVFLPGDEKKKKPQLEPYEINISTFCDYNALVEFIWRLETGNPVLRIKEVRVSANDQPDRQRVELRLEWPAEVTVSGEKSPDASEKEVDLPGDGTENAL
jgi:hypothetical protein